MDDFLCLLDLARAESVKLSCLVARFYSAAASAVGARPAPPHADSRHRTGRCRCRQWVLLSVYSHYTPVSALIRPLLTASTSAAWSRSFWFAYATENSAMARSNVSFLPK